jgi:hypothetical protein
MKEVVYIQLDTALMIIIACFAFTTLILKVVELSRRQ